MLEPPGRKPPDGWPSWHLLAGLAVVCAALGAVLVVLPRGWATALSDVVMIVTHGAAAVWVWSRSRDLRPLGRRAFRWFAVALVAGLVGEVGWALHHSDLLRSGSPGWPNAAYLAAAGAAAAGFVLLSGGPSGPARARLVADGVLLTLAGSLAVAALLVVPALEAGVPTPQVLAAAVWPPVMAGLLGLALVVYFGPTGAHRPSLGLATAALASWAVGTVWTTRASLLREGAAATWTDALVLAAVGLVALAAAVHRDDPQQPRAAPVRGVLVPALVAGALGLGAALAWLSRPMTAGELVLVVLVVVAAVLRRLSTDRESASMQRVFAEQARRDPLTGLGNRTGLAELLGRSRAGSALSLVFLDLDGFKHVNDTLGHVHGDAVLVAVAVRLRDAVPPDVPLVRLGGDEFALVVHGRERAEELAAAVVAAVGRPLVVDGGDVRLSVSAGVASVEPGDEPQLVLERADAAMYVSKSAGPGRVTTWSADLGRRTRADGQLRRDLRAELDGGGAHLRVEHQPVVALATGDVVGTEALVRWDHPVLGTVGPTEFVPLAEDAGLVEVLTERVLDLALADAAAFRRAGADLVVGVNVSPLGLAPALPDQVAGHLERRGVPAGRVSLELTERQLVDGGPATADVLDRLAALGVGLAVDDFGTGFSALSSLTRLPVSRVKLDQSLVADVAGCPDAAAVVESVLGLAERLGLEVVAEGVETFAQAEALAALRCPLAQGFCYGPSVPAATLLERLLGREQAGRASPALPRTRAPLPP